MNRIEACQILGVSTTASEDEINSAFRKLAAKAHPDVNKAPNAEDQFKKLNEAYQFLKSPQQQDPRSVPIDFNDIHSMDSMFDFVFRQSNFNNHTWKYVYYTNNPQPATPPSSCNVTLEFAEAVLGCEKDVTYSQNVLCNACNGQKYVDDFSASVDCNECDGKGVRFYGAVGNQSDRELPCQQCKGNGRIASKLSCPTCNRTGYIQQPAKMKVKFPAGIINGKILNVVNNNKRIKVNCCVKSDPDMTLIGTDVVSNLEITLLEALEGTAKSVRTVKGEKQLKIKALIKHGEVLKVAGFGIPNAGDHLFKVSIKYPDDCTKIIEILRDIDQPKKEN